MKAGEGWKRQRLFALDLMSELPAIENDEIISDKNYE
jgi:hypothetical protein